MVVVLEHLFEIVMTRWPRGLQASHSHFPFLQFDDMLITAHFRTGSVNGASWRGHHVRYMRTYYPRKIPPLVYLFSLILFNVWRTRGRLPFVVQEDYPTLAFTNVSCAHVHMELVARLGVDNVVGLGWDALIDDKVAYIRDFG